MVATRRQATIDSDDTTDDGLSGAVREAVDRIDTYAQQHY
jgi:hypothetical protein